MHYFENGAVLVMRGGGIKNNLNDFIHISYYPKRF
jgi:hypothetical protein